MTYALIESLRFSETTPPRSRHLLRQAFWEMPSREPNAEDSATAFIQVSFREVTPEQGEGTAATVSDTVAQLTESRIPLERALARHLDALLEIAQDERFEDGIASNLSTGLRVLFRDFPTEFPRILEDRIQKGNLRSRVLAEILYVLGQIEDKTTAGWRLATLVDFLKSALPSVRDAAVVGLAYLDDKRAVPYLREAIGREASETLRGDLQAVVEQLST